MMSIPTTRSRGPDLIADLATILAAGVVRLLLRRESPCESVESKRSCAQRVDGERGPEAEILIGGER
jgi:hypothetical protein